MSKIQRSGARKRLHVLLRRLFSVLPRRLRFGLIRNMVSCDPKPDPRLEFKIAETQEELEACFRILHDAYVGAGFMQPDPSGMRVTVYHALPTTTTLCAKFDGQVVGTISIIREGVFGFPLQAIFDLEPVRARGGQIAEISALAVAPTFRKTGGAVLFPMMKYMHEYCHRYFDTRHLVIAVNPDRIELYEALLSFERLTEVHVENYDFANGAPAVGASLDLDRAPQLFRSSYGKRKASKNLHHFFFEVTMSNFRWPQRRYHTTNDPVMTPQLLDHFFSKASNVFERMDNRKKALLWSIYDQPEYRAVLPLLGGVADPDHHPLRRHRRFSMRCPGKVVLMNGAGPHDYFLDVIEISFAGFQAECDSELPLQTEGDATIELGDATTSMLRAKAVRRKQTDTGVFYGFAFDESDKNWRDCIAALEMGQTYQDLG
ncbi:GNAT family N-acetyltransferase [Pelomonas sp. SE-A7]|uniref:GNAT family N-acetyltransferase n=1 Tax=Pelomonas sp. SE-A7 TaxID=3054953 RepID=UPI00259CF8FD|nr:GNAT family N-acetyltransferase [Pelomonas sp. SE-A7]MDM4764862.1 GNAT family N-acetyltransferase [Pelomonas sp. SE-A7]